MEISSRPPKRHGFGKIHSKNCRRGLPHGTDRHRSGFGKHGIGTFDDLSIRQLVSFIKVIAKDKLLVCFKDGTEVEQIIQEV
jgi:hypothetical protein